MVTIQDPTTAFATVMPERGRARAAEIGERFRLGLQGLDCSPTPRPCLTPTRRPLPTWTHHSLDFEPAAQTAAACGPRRVGS